MPQSVPQSIVNPVRTAPPTSGLGYRELEVCKWTFRRRSRGESRKDPIPVGCNVEKRGGKPRLRLLTNTEPTPAPPPIRPFLASAPFRPGELPVTAWVPLDHATRDLVWRRAKEAALPTELWVRIAVESSRLSSEISSLTGRPRREVVGQLDLAATSPVDEGQAPVASELRRYAAELRKGHPAAKTGEVLALRLPEEISGAWNAAASEARLEMPHWIAAALDKTPPECVAWEVAAAATSRSLGEWTYASWLRASTSAKA